MGKFSSLLLAVLTLCVGGTVARAEEEKTTVEVFFAVEYVPAGLKPGARVDLQHVTGRSMTRDGKVALSTSVVTQDLEVVSVTPVEKPQSPQQAIKVTLTATKAQAAKIERFKTILVTAMERLPNGQTETKKVPLTFCLELSKGEKK